MKHTNKFIAAFIGIQAGISSPAFAAPPNTIFFKMDFETPDTGRTLVSLKGYPQWALPPVFDGNYGPGNLFQTVDTNSHTGTYSLRFTYDGHNGFCNTCGVKVVRHKKGLDGVDYFVADDGQDLTRDSIDKPLLDANGDPILNARGEPIIQKTYFPHAAPGKLVYNKSRGFSQWQVTAVQSEGGLKNNKLSLKFMRPGIGAFANEKPIINGNDQIAIARQCGVDGSIGLGTGGVPNPNRRSDCDTAISWLGSIPPNVEPAHDLQPPGASIFRRVYLRADFIDPPRGQKINYTTLLGGTALTRFNPATGKDEPVSATIIPVAERAIKTDDVEPFIGGLGRHGGEIQYRPGVVLPAGLTFERGVWYYIEQEYKAETYTMTTTVTNGQVTVDTYKGNGDGAYRFWMTKSGEPDGPPLIDLTGIPLPPLKGGTGKHMSFWGNFQHVSHSRGTWYMDDIVISNTRVGPIINPIGNNKQTTKPPGT